MKGWVKGMLIGAAACIGFGTLVSGAAWAMGGRFSYFRNRSIGFTEGRWEEFGEDEPVTTSEIPREIPQEIPLAEGVYEEPAPGTDEGAGRTGNGTPGGAGQNGSGGEARSGAAVIRELEIKVIGGLVQVVTDDSTDQIVVVSGNEDYQCRQEIDGDELEIYVGLNSGLWQDWFGGREVSDSEYEEDLAAQIRIPADAAFRQVEIEVKGGGVKMSQVNAAKLNLDVEAGSLEVLGGSVEKLEGECKTGELIYEGQVETEMEAECITGNVQYRIKGVQEDFRYKVDSKAGSIVIDGEEEGALNRESVIDNPGAVKKADFECKTGVIDVSFH